MPHLPDDRLTLVRRLYETSEMTIAEIAVLADVSESAIYQRARRERWTNWRRPGVTPRRAKPRPPLAPTPALLALGHGRDADCRDPGRIEDAETGEAGATPHDRAPLDRNPLDRAATARRLWLAVDRHLADLETYGGPEGMIRAAQNLATLARTLETLVDVERELAPEAAPRRALVGRYGEPAVACHRPGRVPQPSGRAARAAAGGAAGAVRRRGGGHGGGGNLVDGPGRARDVGGGGRLGASPLTSSRREARSPASPSR